MNATTTMPERCANTLRRDTEPLGGPMPVQPTCTVPDCNHPRRYRLLCSMHYQRLRAFNSFDAPSTTDRFWKKVNKDGPVSAKRPDLGPCWIWTAATNGKYGKLSDGTRLVYAHRYSYELAFGAIPENLQIDHLCEVRLCVNPRHLEPVTVLENVRRGSAQNANKTRCPQGHEYTPENTHWYTRGASVGRRCRRCAFP